MMSESFGRLDPSRAFGVHKRILSFRVVGERRLLIHFALRVHRKQTTHSQLTSSQRGDKVPALNVQYLLYHLN